MERCFKVMMMLREVVSFAGYRQRSKLQTSRSLLKLSRIVMRVLIYVCLTDMNRLCSCSLRVKMPDTYNLEIMYSICRFIVRAALVSSCEVLQLADQTNKYEARDLAAWLSYGQASDCRRAVRQLVGTCSTGCCPEAWRLLSCLDGETTCSAWL